jgi:hypothetical protein
MLGEALWVHSEDRPTPEIPTANVMTEKPKPAAVSKAPRKDMVVDSDKKGNIHVDSQPAVSV